MIQVELFDGTVLEFPEGTAQDVIDRVAKQETLARQKPTREVIGTTQDGGKVYRGADGALSYAGPSYATSDPEKVRQIMEGMTPADVSKASIQEGIVAENPVVSRAIKAVEGVPFVGSYVDEAAGAMFGDKAQAGVRAASAAMEQSKPGQSAALQLGGGIAGAIPMALAAGPLAVAKAPASMAGRVITGLLGGAAAGAGEGFVYGTGRGEDGNRVATGMEDMRRGAVTGGIVGGILPLASSAVRRTWDAASDALMRRSRSIPGVSPAATDQILMRAGADDIGGAGMANMARLGDDAMLADAGPSMRALTDQAVAMSPTGANVAGKAVGERSSRIGGQLQSTFDDVMGGPQGAKALSDAITEETQPGIRSAYKQAYDVVIDYSDDAGKKIEEIVSRIPKGVKAKAIQMANDRMVWDGMPPQMLIQIGENGVTAQPLNRVIHLDYIKRALDQIATDGTDPITKRMNGDASFAANIAKTLRNAVKDAVPAYAEALDKASDGFALRNASELGQSLLNPQTTREMVSDWAKDAGTLERKALAEGLRSNIDERMANVRRAVSNGTLNFEDARKIVGDMSSDAVKTKIKAVFGEAEATKILGVLDKASAALELQAGIAANSKTAPRAVGDAMLREATEYSPGEIARTPFVAPKKVLDIFMGNTPMDKAARNEQVYGEIANLLTGPRGPAAQNAAQGIAGLLNWVPQANATSAMIGRGTAGALGLLGYLQANQSQRGMAR